MAPSTKRAAKPASSTSTVELSGLMGPQIAGLVISGEITQAQAEKFVAERAVRKFGKSLAAAREQA